MCNIRTITMFPVPGPRAALEQGFVSKIQQLEKGRSCSEKGREPKRYYNTHG
jgi:hypothetical protein